MITNRKWIDVLFCILCFSSCSSLKFTEELKNPFQIAIHSIACSDAPLVKAKIEGTEYLLMLDLGCSSCLMLKDRVLNQLSHKEFMGMSRIFDINGNIYEQSEYKIPHVRFGSFEIADVQAIEENYLFIREGNKIGTKRYPPRTQDQIDQIDGKIGAGLFDLSESICYFDMSRSIFCMGTALDQVIEDYPLVDFVENKIEVIDGFVCLDVLTDRGMKKFMLDTGASCSLIQKMAEDGREIKMDLELFGRRRFFTFDLPENVPFDGILGIDFFDDYKVCLDFSNRRIYTK